MENKDERLKSAKNTKREILNRLHKYELKTKIFYDITYHSLKTKELKDEYLTYKWKLKETFKVIDEIGENPEKFREKIEKEEKMQEIMKDGSEGKAFVEDTIEDLLPHIKKSLENPNVKFVKVFRGKKLDQIPFEDKEEFIAEEEKCNVIEEILNEDEEKKKTQLRIPKNK